MCFYPKPFRWFLTAALFVSILPCSVLAQQALPYSHSWGSVYEKTASAHLVKTVNVMKWSEGGRHVGWTPVKTGVQAVLRFKYSFGTVPAQVFLQTHMTTWNYSLGVGYGAVYCSSDAMKWIKVLDAPTPKKVGAGYGQKGFLPKTVLGAKTLYIEVRMMRVRGSYPYGGVQYHRFSPPNSSWYPKFKLLALPDSVASLTGSSTSLSASTGGNARLQLQAPPSAVNQIYMILGSVSGTSPGLSLGKLTLPLNYDPYLYYLAANPNALISGSMGIVSSKGNTATLTLPARMANPIVGLTLNHSALILTHGPKFLMVSNAVPLKITR